MRVHRLDTHPGPQTEAFNSPATEILYGGAAGGGKLAPVRPERYGVDGSTGVVQGVHGKWCADQMNIPESTVMTPTGPKLLGDMQVGDRVCTPDGGISKVIAVHKPGVFPIYRVTMADGSVTHAADEHLWTYSLAGRRRSRKRPPLDRHALGALGAAAMWCAEVAMRCRTANTDALRADLDAARDANGRAHYPQLPMARPLPFCRGQGRWPTLTPYVIGAMIGDGACGSPGGLGFTSDPADRAIVDRISEELPEGVTLVQSRSEPKAYHFRGASRIRELLDRDGLLGKRSWEKRIPHRLLYAPTEQRWALAQGLFDTDGYMDDRGHIEYVTVSEGLAQDVQHLVRSLGFRATLTSKRGSYRNADGDRVECRIAYRLYIQGVEKSSLFFLPRKRDRAAPFNGNDVMLSHRVESVEFVGHQTGMCITVDHPLGLYVTDDFIVTHNSHLMRLKHLVSALTIPGYMGFIFRLTSDELVMNHLEGPGSFPEMCRPWIENGAVEYNSQKMRFTFKETGAVVRFRHMGDESRKGQAQGPDISGLSLDEATHFDEDMYRWLRGRCRHTVALPKDARWDYPWILLGSNPGGRGHGWVKRTFIDMCEPMEIRDMGKLFPDGSEGGFLRQFIPAKVEDNPSIDPQKYRMALRGLGRRELVEAMANGNWDIALGARFGESWSDRVMVPEFKIPSTWKLSRSLDWGTAKPFSYGLWATSNGEQPVGDSLPYIPPGSKIRIAEIYGWNGHPDQGCRKPARTVAKEIRMFETRLGVHGRVQPGAADPKTWKQESDMRSAADAFKAEGVPFVAAYAGPNSRVPGWRLVDDMLAAASDRAMEAPMLLAFERCQHFKRLMPSVPCAKNDPDDVDTKSEDHLPDEVRYECTRAIGHAAQVRAGGI